MERLKLQFNPYTYVRVVTKRSKLLRKDDYDKLLKLSFPEIAKLLQDGEYKKEIDELGIYFKGSILIERALLKNLQSTFDYLKNIACDDIIELINSYEKRYHLFNVKTIIRAKSRGMPSDEIIKLLLLSERRKNEYIKLTEKSDIHDILSSLLISKSPKFVSALKYYQETGSLLFIEYELDLEYYRSLFDLAERIPMHGEMFKEFLLAEIDILNLLSLLKLKLEGLTSEQIYNLLLPFGKVLSKRILYSLVQKDYASILETLAHTPFKDIVEEHKKELEEKQLINFEHALNKYLLHKTSLLSHQNPLSVDTILNFMFSKNNEVRNLMILIKGKELGVDESYIEHQLVV